MATKKHDVLALLDKAVGKKGPLRIPAYWMREVLLKIMDWAEGLIQKVEVPTKISQLENDAGLATQSYVNSKATITYDNSIKEAKTYADSCVGDILYNIKPIMSGDVNFNTLGNKHMHYICTGTAPGRLVFGTYIPSANAISSITYYFTGVSSLSLSSETIWETEKPSSLDASKHYALTITQIRYDTFTVVYRAKLE